MKLFNYIEELHGYFLYFQIFRTSDYRKRSVVASRHYPVPQLLDVTLDRFNHIMPGYMLYNISHTRAENGKLYCIFLDSIELEEITMSNVFQYIKNKQR